MAHPWAFGRFRGRVLYDFSKFARDALSKEEAVRKVKSLKTALAVATARHDVNEVSRLKAEIEYYSEELADPTLSLSGDAEFHEEDHPRGQPGNAGQFGSGGGSKSESGSEEPSKDPAIEKFRAESRAKSKGGMSAAELRAKFKPVAGGAQISPEFAKALERLEAYPKVDDPFSENPAAYQIDMDDLDNWDPVNLPEHSPAGFQFDFDKITQDPAKAPKDVLVRAKDGHWYVNNQEVPVVKTVHEALILLGAGKGVMFERPEKAVALLDKIRKITDDARKLGKKAPTYNLCQVYVASTNLFCEKNMGIPRDQMPQLGGNPTPGSLADKLPRGKFGGVDVTDAWVKELKDSGVEVEETTLDASLLRGTQNELNGAKVAGIADSFFKHGIPTDETRLVVSDENYVVDGHHRWAAEVAYKQALGKPVNIRVYRVKRPILPLLNSAIEFGNKMGMPKVSVHEAGSKAA